MTTSSIEARGELSMEGLPTAEEEASPPRPREKAAPGQETKESD